MSVAELKSQTSNSYEASCGELNPERLKQLEQEDRRLKQRYALLYQKLNFSRSICNSSDSLSFLDFK